jgi:membrane-associated phospholipid phosphatase
MTASLAVFPFMPALGGYLHYGRDAANYPGVLVGAAWDFEPVISHARDGTLRVLGETPVIGLVTFPSFHAAGAIILGWTARHVSGGLFLIALNLLMLLSTVPIGGHYLTDVVAGSCVAVAALAFANLPFRRIASARLDTVPVGATQPSVAG